MSLAFAIIFIITITCLMVLAMFIRAKNRDNARYYAIDFCHEGDCWKIAVRMARFWWLLWTQVRVMPGDLLSFRPQVAYTVHKNGRVIIALPNFWADSIGAAICKVGKTDCLTMQAEIVFRNLAMACAFEKRLREMGHSAILAHNKVVFEPLTSKNHNCNHQGCHNADNIGKNRP